MASVSTMVGTRLDLARLCNAHGLNHAVEVGTDRGVFAREFLDLWLGDMMWCFDPYAPYDHMPYDRTADLAMAVHLLSPHIRRCRVVRAPSPEAVKCLYDGWRPSFVYIDGDHSYEAVMADLDAWWDAMEPKGVLAGHDYDPDHNPGVPKAVDEFAAGKGLRVELTTDYNMPRSWFIRRGL